MIKTLINSWQCPYCLQNATIREGDMFEEEKTIPRNSHNTVIYGFRAITCPNSLCGKLTAHISLKNGIPSSDTFSFLPDNEKYEEYFKDSKIQKINVGLRLLPFSNVKIFPDYVPQAIRDDYEEASRIVQLSPKASATLSRRCLQGIIRDFFEIKGKRRLIDEINTLSKIENDSKFINAELIAAFHNLKNVGNIGAHMEEDVNLIIEVTPKEAGVLISFIENLIELTYIKRDETQKLYVKLNQIDIKTKEKRIRVKILLESAL